VLYGTGPDEITGVEVFEPVNRIARLDVVSYRGLDAVQYAGLLSQPTCSRLVIERGVRGLTTVHNQPSITVVSQIKLWLRW
jgi:hypothetical protein